MCVVDRLTCRGHKAVVNRYRYDSVHKDTKIGVDAGTRQKWPLPQISVTTPLHLGKRTSLSRDKCRNTLRNEAQAKKTESSREFKLMFSRAKEVWNISFILPSCRVRRSACYLLQNVWPLRTIICNVWREAVVKEDARPSGKGGKFHVDLKQRSHSHITKQRNEGMRVSSHAHTYTRVHGIFMWGVCFPWFLPTEKLCTCSTHALKSQNIT